MKQIALFTHWFANAFFGPLWLVLIFFALFFFTIYQGEWFSSLATFAAFSWMQSYYMIVRQLPRWIDAEESKPKSGVYVLGRTDQENDVRLVLWNDNEWLWLKQIHPGDEPNEIEVLATEVIKHWQHAPSYFVILSKL